MADLTKQRITSSTARTADNIRQVVSALACGDMTRDELEKLLGMSRSGTRKYLVTLRADYIISIVRFIDPTPHTPGEAVYRLTGDAERLRAYLAGLQPSAAPRARKPMPHIDPGLHVHRIGDDSLLRQHGPVHNAIPLRDPLMAALYGPR